MPEEVAAPVVIFSRSITFTCFQWNYMGMQSVNKCVLYLYTNHCLL